MTSGASLSRFDILVSMRETRFLETCLFIAILLFLAPSAFPQNPTQTDTTIGGIKSLYDNGSYISAELVARRILEGKSVSDSIRVQLEKYVAFSLVAQGENDAAVDHFRNALEIDSSLTLDAILTSPKILGVFETAKNQFEMERQKERSQASLDTSSKRNTFRHETGGPTFRAILFPGWEQSFRGGAVKGHVLLGAGAITALSWATLDFLRRDARTSYLAASTPDLASSRYKTYNSYYKAEFYSATAFIVIYAYSAVDAFLNLPPYFDLDYSPSSSSAKLSLRVHF